MEITTFLTKLSPSHRQYPLSRSSTMIMAIWILIFITGLDGLRNVRLEGPHHVRSGEDVILRCNYELDNDSIYVVKWYRGSQEFYRFVPKEVPPKRFFSNEGLAFKEAYCNEHDIFLRNVSLETTGKFKCAVSAEMTFQTFIAAQDLVIVAIEYMPPLVQVEQASYYPGDNVKANCSVGQVSHSLNFTWFINNQEVPSSLQRQITLPDPDDPTLIKSVSLLQFEMGTTAFSSVNATTTTTVKHHHRQTTIPLNGDDTRLKCRADLFELYSEVSEEIVIQTTQPRYSPSNQDTLRRNNPPINVNNEGVSSSSPSLHSTITTTTFVLSSSRRNLILGMMLLVVFLIAGNQGLHLNHHHSSSQFCL